MSSLRLLALVQKVRGISPGQRFRLEQWEPFLRERHDIHLDYAAFESPALAKLLYEPGHLAAKGALMARDAMRRADVLSLARRYDGVVVYREAMPIGPALYERVLAAMGVPLFLDFDDAIWIGNVASVNGLFSHLRFPTKTSALCRMSRAVSVGNEYLASYAQRHSPSVHVVRTSIDLDKYTLQPRPTSHDPIVIGWTGSKSTLTHLELARAWLERLAQRRRVRLRVVCSEPPRPVAGVELEFVPWTAEREAVDLGGLHVGIMPLPDDTFAKGKCACKALQYMAVGCPVVIAPVGMNAELISSGDNGILAGSDDECISAVEKLADDPAGANRMGLAGRRTVEEGYSAERSAERFATMIRTGLESA